MFGCARRGLAAWGRDRRGTTAIEFAVALPLLAVTFFGFAQIAWTQHCATSLRYALSTVSRTLLVNPTLTQTQLQDMVRAKLGGADPNVSVTLAVATTSSGKFATLSGAYDRSIMLPLLPTIPIHYRTKVVTALPIS